MDGTPNVAQQNALDCWTQGHNLRLQAPPGTGKTWMILKAASLAKTSDPGADILIVAYNTELAADIVAQLEAHGFEDGVRCFTFHGLCTHFLELAADDVSLESCIHRAEQGMLESKELLAPTHVLVDESQDLNDLHVRLLKVLLRESTHERQFLIAGDVHQMLYDYGEHPSSTKYLSNFESSFSSGRKWYDCQLDESRRITPHMATLVDAHFTTGLRSSRLLDGNVPPVHVHGVSKWGMGCILQSILDAHHADTDWARMSILVSQKANNAPLRSALNHISAHEIPLYVHGIDGTHESIRCGKVRVSSWHASKGTEADVAIVLIPAHCKINPLYVALTRAREHLHILLVRDDADVAFCQTLARLYDSSQGCIRLENAAAGDILSKVLLVPPEIIQAQSDVRHLATHSDRHNRALDNGVRDVAVHRYITGCRHASASDSVPPALVVRTSSSNAEHVGDVYLCAVLCRLEYELTGKIRRMEDCISPSRLSPPVQDRILRCGHQARIVSPNVSDTSLLARELRETGVAAYRNPSTVDDWCTIAATTLSWNSYHHRMRQLLPTRAWTDTALFERAVETAAKALRPSAQTSIQFDVRLAREVENPSGTGSTLLHIRAPAVCDGVPWYVVWDEITSAHRDEAAVRAAFSATKRCDILSVATGATVEVDVTIPDMLSDIVSQMKRA